MIVDPRRQHVHRLAALADAGRLDVRAQPPDERVMALRGVLLAAFRGGGSTSRRRVVKLVNFDTFDVCAVGVRIRPRIRSKSRELHQLHHAAGGRGQGS